MAFEKKHAKWLIGLLAVVAIAAFFYFDLGKWLSLENLKSQQVSLSNTVDQHFWLSVLIFFLVYVAVAAFSLPGAAVLTLAGGAIFGLVTGFITVSFASSIGALIAFLGARFLFRDAIKKRLADRLAPI